jgi:dipeptidyl aminopeptidase/acylaminoacyl peptidase
MQTNFEPDDLYLYREVKELQGSCDGDLAVCEVSMPDRRSDTNQSFLWQVFLNEMCPPRQLSYSGSDTSPRCHPSERTVAFISNRGGGGRQIHLLPLDGGEARPLTSIESGVMSFEWSPNGKALLALSTVSIDPERRGGSTPARECNSERVANAPRLVWRLPYKLDGVGYTLDTAVHMFSIDSASGEATQLTGGPFEVNSAEWSPDGKRIAFARTREGRTAHRTDVWLIDGTGENARQITTDVASCSCPHWSPDGNRIIFSGSLQDGDAQVRLWFHDLATGETHGLGDEDIEVVSGATVSWFEDSSKAFFLLARRGRQEIVSITVPGGEMTHLVTGDRQVDAFSRRGSNLFYSCDNGMSPKDVWTCAEDGSGERCLTNFNPWWNSRRAPNVQIRKFEVPDGDGGKEMIEGWLVTPSGEDLKGPLLVDAHGGPASYALLPFNWHVYWYVLASQGWSILALNPVGSSSYGRQFSSRAKRRWGECDLDQQLAAVETLRTEGRADERLAITGKSYGGYLSAWAIGNSTAFRAAVVSSPVTSIESHFGVSDSGYYADAYSMYGEPSVKRDEMRALSPLSYVEKVLTPTLILQGEADERCPVCQAEELFTGIMTATDTPAEMVIYPGGSHHFYEKGKPSHREDMIRRLVQWLTRWVDEPVLQGRG